MINDIEIKFINDYIIKVKRDRLLFELGNEKRREKAIMRFSHDAEQFINPKKIVYCGETLTEREANDFFKKNKNKSFYVVSTDKKDESVLPTETALTYSFSEYMPVILIGETCSFIKCESEFGSSKKMILFNQLSAKML
ncbi:MAG: hypothetical protein IJ811_04930 [Clostridia bacterium]|nr:hypothetical protein [Clostridia bacterium]